MTKELDSKFSSRNYIPDILIAIPCYDRKIQAETTVSLLSTTIQLLHMNARAALFTAPGCALITHVRNLIVTEFLRRPEKTHLLFVDADMEWSPETVIRMLAANVPFAAAAYPNKTYTPTADAMAGGWDEAHAAALQWHVQFADPRVSTGAAPPETVNGFAKAIRVGGGLMLLRRDMIEAMIAKYADTRYSWHGPEGVSSHYGLFELMKFEDGSISGEDYAFCDRWVTGCGGEILIDLEAAIVHHGHHGYRGKLKDTLALRAKRLKRS